MVDIIQHVAIANFHHTLGPIIEWVYPPFPAISRASAGATDTNDPPPSPTTPTGPYERVQLPREWAAMLPFCALPDGSHLRDQGFNAFHLPPVPGWPAAAKTTFATSCYRQMPASELLVKPPDVTRPMVQKAVVVLSTEPVFGAIREKLDVVTAAFFEQRDFTKREIIMSLFDSLRPAFQKCPDSMFSMGINFRGFVSLFREKALAMLKLLLLQKRVMVISSDMETLINTQYAVVSVIPNLLMHLHNAGSPHLVHPIPDPLNPAIAVSDPPTLYVDPDTNLPMTTSKLLACAGLPLDVFSSGCVFQPYLPLQQVDALGSPDTKAFLFGTTNGILRDHRTLRLDAVVTCEPEGQAGVGGGSVAGGGDGVRIDCMDPALESLLYLTPPDRKWINDLLNQTILPPPAPATAPSSATPTAGPGNAGAVGGTGSGKSSPDSMPYSASDDHVRGLFEQYLLAFLSTLLWATSSADSVPELVSIEDATPPTVPVDVTEKSPSGSTHGDGTQPAAENNASATDPPTSPKSPSSAPSSPSKVASPTSRSPKLGKSAEGTPTGLVAVDPNDPDAPARKQRLLDEFHGPWVKAFQNTAIHAAWLLEVNPNLPIVVEPGHPCQGHTLTALLQERLSSKIAEFHLDEKKAAIQASIASAVSTGGRLFQQYTSKVKEEAAKRQQQNTGAGQTEEVAQKTSMAATKAKQYGISLWGAATSYVASKRAEYAAAHSPSANSDNVPKIPSPVPKPSAPVSTAATVPEADSSNAPSPTHATPQHNNAIGLAPEVKEGVSSTTNPGAEVPVEAKSSGSPKAPSTMASKTDPLNAELPPAGTAEASDQHPYQPLTTSSED